MAALPLVAALIAPTELVALSGAIRASAIGMPTKPSPSSTTIAGVARAKDGDSIMIGKLDTRLFGIDAPEHDQICQNTDGDSWPCGQEAKAALARLVNDKQLRCDVRDVEPIRGRRPIVRCFDGNHEINVEMVRLGLAVVFDRYVSATPNYLTLQGIESEAKAAGRGMWAGTFERPEDYRANRWERYKARSPKGCPIVATVKSKVYRTPWSGGYSVAFEKASSPGRAAEFVWFCDEEEAVKAGYRVVPAQGLCASHEHDFRSELGEDAVRATATSAACPANRCNSD